MNSIPSRSELTERRFQKSPMLSLRCKSWKRVMIVNQGNCELPGKVFFGEAPTVEVDGDRQRCQLVDHLIGES